MKKEKCGPSDITAIKIKECKCCWSGMEGNDMDSSQWYMLLAGFMAIWMLMLMRFWNNYGI